MRAKLTPKRLVVKNVAFLLVADVVIADNEGDEEGGEAFIKDIKGIGIVDEHRGEGEVLIEHTDIPAVYGCIGALQKATTQVKANRIVVDFPSAKETCAHTAKQTIVSAAVVIDVYMLMEESPILIADSKERVASQVANELLVRGGDELALDNKGTVSLLVQHG